jgi:hypothetical protein
VLEIGRTVQRNNTRRASLRYAVCAALVHNCTELTNYFSTSYVRGWEKRSRSIADKSRFRAVSQSYRYSKLGLH